MTIADSLTLLASTKTAIAAAIENKGVTVGAIPFSQYPSKIAEISGGGGPPTPQPDPWVRPADWLPLPEITENDNMFVGLLAITNDEANYIALSAAGNYTVDWGDGTIENYNSNVTAQHYYDYNNTALVGTECSRGYRQAVVKVTPQSGATFTGINLQLRHSAMPALIYNVQWLDLAMGGATLSDIRFAQSAASPSSAILIRIHWCEQVKIVRMSRTTMSNMFFNCYGLQSVLLFDTAKVTSMSSMFYDCSSLQTVPLFNTANVTIMSSMFYGCSRLQTVPLFNTANVTSMSSMFFNCSSLQTVPLFNTAKVTTMSNMFFNCYSLQTVPLFDTANVTSMSSMFYDCSSLQTVPLFNTANVTNMSSMFYGCSRLQTVPLFNTANVTSMSSMFSGCYGLQSVPLFNTAKVTNMSNMFFNCYGLQSVPLFNTANVTNMSSMFYGCYGLQSVPLFDTAKVTSMSSMFYQCYGLQSVPLFNTANVTNMSYMFQNCYSLQSVPLFNTAKVTNMSYTFFNCYSLQSVSGLNTAGATTTSMYDFMFTGCFSLASAPLVGTKFNISYTNCKLSRSALVAIFNGLADLTGGTARTITITGNFGAAQLTQADRDIALNKNWTITG